MDMWHFSANMAESLKEGCHNVVQCCQRQREHDRWTKGTAMRLTVHQGTAGSNSIIQQIPTCFCEKGDKGNTVLQCLSGNAFCKKRPLGEKEGKRLKALRAESFKWEEEKIGSKCLAGSK